MNDYQQLIHDGSTTGVLRAPVSLPFMFCTNCSLSGNMIQNELDEAKQLIKKLYEETEVLKGALSKIESGNVNSAVQCRKDAAPTIRRRNSLRLLQEACIVTKQKSLYLDVSSRSDSVDFTSMEFLGTPSESQIQHPVIFNTLPPISKEPEGPRRRRKSIDLLQNACIVSRQKSAYLETSSRRNSLYEMNDDEEDFISQTSELTTPSKEHYSIHDENSLTSVTVNTVQKTPSDMSITNMVRNGFQLFFGSSGGSNGGGNVTTEDSSYEKESDDTLENSFENQKYIIQNEDNAVIAKESEVINEIHMSTKYSESIRNDAMIDDNTIAIQSEEFKSKQSINDMKHIQTYVKNDMQLQDEHGEKYGGILVVHPIVSVCDIDSTIGRALEAEKEMILSREGYDDVECSTSRNSDKINIKYEEKVMNRINNQICIDKETQTVYVSFLDNVLHTTVTTADSDIIIPIENKLDGNDKTDNNCLRYLEQQINEPYSETLLTSINTVKNCVLPYKYEKQQGGQETVNIPTSHQSLDSKREEDDIKATDTVVIYTERIEYLENYLERLLEENELLRADLVQEHLYSCDESCFMKEKKQRSCGYF